MRPKARSDPAPEWHGRAAVTRFAAPLAGYAVAAWVGVQILRGDADAVGWLVAAVFLLMMSAAGNCWDLLREIGDRHAIDRAMQCCLRGWTRDCGPLPPPAAARATQASPLQTRPGVPRLQQWLPTHLVRQTRCAVARADEALSVHDKEAIEFTAADVVNLQTSPGG